MWGSFAPVSIGVCAYNSATRTWHEMPDAPWPRFSDDAPEPSYMQQIAGASLV